MTQPATASVSRNPSSPATADAIRFDAPRLWLGSESGGPTVRLFRRKFDVASQPDRATLRVFAESRYHVWVNEAYVARGPILHHPNRLPVTELDVTQLLKPGENVVAVLVVHFGTPLHNYIPMGKPGLVAELAWSGPGDERGAVRTDDEWRVTDQTGWSSEVPRRGWAIGFIEHFDAAKQPQDWTHLDFDDSDWLRPTLAPSALPSDDAVYFADPLPPLRHAWQPAERVVSFHEVSEPAPPLLRDYRHGDYATKLMDTKFEPTRRVSLRHPEHAEDALYAIEGLTPEAGAVLNLDLGAEYTGTLILDARCASGGTIDFGWSEWLDGDRPRVRQKGTSYVDRIDAAPGELRWEQVQFTAGRYLSLWFRGFTGSVAIYRVGMRATEPSLDWTARFDSSDETLNRIWRLCERTQRIGTQEGLMDCPTREQACYIGDGHPVARWLFQLTGDASHWKYLVREQFARQAANGLVRSTPFSGRDDILIDYTLLAIVHTREYMRFTGDRETPRALLRNCHDVLRWFDSHADDRGMFAWRWSNAPREQKIEHVYDPHGPHLDHPHAHNLFIDHPGMGWHNVGEAGIDRRGLNAAINALIIEAREALADLEQAVGSREEAVRLRQRAGADRRTAQELFFDPDRGVFVDGVLDGARLPQVTQHTNAWALSAGLWPNENARQALRRIFVQPAADVAHGGPYFWIYLYPAMQALGLEREAVEETRRLWTPMLDGGATALWETFKGDDLDTACHPWSGAPVEFLLTGVAGLPALALPGSRVHLRPRYDLVDRMDARIMTAAGPIEIAWSREGKKVTLRGSLPPGVTGELFAADASSVGEVGGSWSKQL